MFGDVKSEEDVRLEPATVPPANHHNVAQPSTIDPSARQSKKDSGEMVKNKTVTCDAQSSKISEYEFSELPVLQPPQCNTISALEDSYAQISFRNATFLSGAQRTSLVTPDQRVQPPFSPVRHSPGQLSLMRPLPLLQQT